MPKTNGSVVFWGKHDLNKLIPKENVMYKTLRPSEIVLGTPKIDSTRATLQDVSCVHWNIKAIGTNDTKTSSVVAIALSISDERGGHYLMYLKTGIQIHS